MSKSFLTISFSPENHFLKTSWLRPVSSQEYRHGIRMIAVCITTLEVKFALTDFSSIGTPPLEDQHCTANFLRKALKNTSLQRCARILSDNRLQWKAYEEVMEQTLELPYSTGGFRSLEEAESWLFMSEKKQQVNAEVLCSISLESNPQTLRKLLQSISSKESKIEILPLPESLTGKSITDNISVCDTEFLNATIDTCNNLLTVRWLRAVSSSEYRYGIMKAGQSIIDNQLDKVLLINQKLGVLALDDQRWFSNNFTDFVSKSSLKRVAVVTSQDTLQQLATAEADGKIKRININYEPSYFFSADEALEWLLLRENVRSYKMRAAVKIQ